MIDLNEAAKAKQTIKTIKKSLHPAVRTLIHRRGKTEQNIEINSGTPNNVLKIYAARPKDDRLGREARNEIQKRDKTEIKLLPMPKVTQL